MDYLIDWQKKDLKFNGKDISFEVFPLENQDVLKLLPYVQKFSNPDNIEQETLLKLLNLSKEIFPKNVRNIIGITLNGSPINPEDIARHGVFLNLALGIITSLINVSVPSKIEEKN